VTLCFHGSGKKWGYIQLTPKTATTIFSAKAIGPGTNKNGDPHQTVEFIFQRLTSGKMWFVAESDYVMFDQGLVC
jgi:hypothetical protein